MCIRDSHTVLCCNSCALGGVVMDIATSLGLLCGVGVVGLVIMMGGDLHMFVSEHAFIVIFGGSFAATLIRFPFSSIMHGLPLGAKFAFSTPYDPARTGR